MTRTRLSCSADRPARFARSETTEGNDMNANISTARPLIAVWLLVGIGTVSGASTGRPYLPATGPTPLRFEVVYVKPPTPAPLVAAGSPVEKPDETDPGTVDPIPTNTLPDVHYSAGEPRPPTDLPGEATVDPAPPHAVNDRPMIITQQMLAEYFKPAAGSTNAPGVSVFLPVPVTFKPPTDAVAPRSRATYKTE